MKCDDCLNLLEQYLDGEATPREAEQVSAHLTACVGCNQEWEMLTAEQELYARYDRELEVPPSLWAAVAARTAEDVPTRDLRTSMNVRPWWAGLFSTRGFGLAFAGAMAVLLVALSGSALYLRSQRQTPGQPLASGNKVQEPGVPRPENPAADSQTPADDQSRGTAPSRQLVSMNSRAPVTRKVASSAQSDVLFKDDADTDIEDRDTASHLEQAQNLLRSVRNLQFSDTDEEVDVSYEKAQSRRLLNENVVLRRDAEMAGKFPAKSVLGSLEPFLIDIANLPDKASPAELRQLRERVQRTEIVAALQSY
jgi:Putative zinc-finger